MVKGVNRQVLELLTPPGAYFERVLFFVKPEFSAASENTLQKRAKYIAESAGLPPALRIKKSRRRMIVAVLGSALAGIAMGAGTVLLMVVK